LKNTLKSQKRLVTKIENQGVIKGDTFENNMQTNSNHKNNALIEMTPKFNDKQITRETQNSIEKVKI